MNPATSSPLSAPFEFRSVSGAWVLTAAAWTEQERDRMLGELRDLIDVVTAVFLGGRSVNVTALRGVRRHLARPGDTVSWCGAAAHGPGLTDAGLLSQRDIDALPLCRVCERRAQDA